MDVLKLKLHMGARFLHDSKQIAASAAYGRARVLVGTATQKRDLNVRPYYIDAVS